MKRLISLVFALMLAANIYASGKIIYLFSSNESKPPVLTNPDDKTQSLTIGSEIPIGTTLQTNFRTEARVSYDETAVIISMQKSTKMTVSDTVGTIEIVLSKGTVIIYASASNTKEIKVLVNSRKVEAKTVFADFSINYNGYVKVTNGYVTLQRTTGALYTKVLTTGQFGSIMSETISSSRTGSSSTKSVREPAPPPERDRSKEPPSPRDSEPKSRGPMNHPDNKPHGVDND